MAARGGPTVSFIREYIFSTDHKTIGKQYILLGWFAAIIGMLLSMLMRWHLVYPDMKLPGGVMTPEFYLSLMTMHGTIMVFFVLTTVPQSGFGNYFIPLEIGAEDMAFPVLNMLSFWTTAVSLAVLLLAAVVEGGGPISGWTAYPPLSAIGAIAGPGQGAGQTLWVISIAIFCAASLMAAINFIATILELRRDMPLFEMPIAVWGWFITAVISLLAFGVLLAGGILLLLDRVAGTSFFIPAGLLASDRVLTRGGGSPILWQHLFWFFGHPEVYIAILPGMGVISTVLSYFSSKPLFGYKAMVWAMIAIAFLGFVVWGHHMYVSGMSPYSAIAFSVLTLGIGVPSAIKTFNWIATVWGGQIRFSTPMLFALGFVSVFVTGGLTGLVLGQPALDLYFHDTYFVVAHFHMIMGVASIFAIFAGLYYWFPRMWGRRMSERLGKWHFFLTFIGVHLIFIPMHFVGLVGNPRRYPDFKDVEFLGALIPMHKAISHSAMWTGLAQLLFSWNFFRSMFKGEAVESGSDPWK